MSAHRTNCGDCEVLQNSLSGLRKSNYPSLYAPSSSVREFKNEEKTVQAEKIDKEIYKLLEENRVLKNQINVLEEQLNYFEIFKIVFGLLLIVLIFIILKRVKS